MFMRDKMKFIAYPMNYNRPLQGIYKRKKVRIIEENYSCDIMQRKLKTFLNTRKTIECPENRKQTFIKLHKYSSHQSFTSLFDLFILQKFYKRKKGKKKRKE